MRFADFLRNQLTVGLQTRYMSFDGLDCPHAALFDRAALGKAAGQGRNSDEEAAAWLGLDDDGVSTHQLPSCHSTPRRSSTLRPARLRTDRSKPDPIVRPQDRSVSSVEPGASVLYQGGLLGRHIRRRPGPRRRVVARSIL